MPTTVKSDASAPLSVKYGEPRVSVPDPLQADMAVVEQLLTETPNAADVVFVPCFPNAKVGDGAQFALLPTCPRFGQITNVAPPPPAVEMVIVKLALAVCAGLEESVTSMVNESDPTALGVPLIWPELFSARPAGKLPELSDQLYGVVPPLAASVAEYGVPSVVLANEVVVIDKGVVALDLTVKSAELLKILPAELLTRTQKVSPLLPVDVTGVV